LQDYLSPVGKQGISELLSQAAAIEMDYINSSKRMRDLRNPIGKGGLGDEYMKLARQRKALLAGFDVDKVMGSLHSYLCHFGFELRRRVGYSKRSHMISVCKTVYR